VTVRTPTRDVVIVSAGSSVKGAAEALIDPPASATSKAEAATVIPRLPLQVAEDLVMNPAPFIIGSAQSGT
jgi:hypothetical protein